MPNSFLSSALLRTGRTVMVSPLRSTRNSSPGARCILFRMTLGRATRPALSTEALNFLLEVYRFSWWDSAAPLRGKGEQPRLQRAGRNGCSTVNVARVVGFRGVGWGGLRCEGGGLRSSG